MLTRRIIACLDVTNGRVVKGTNFLALRDAGDPVELAALYNEQGADELTFLDITASSDNRETMVDVVRRAADQLFIPLAAGRRDPFGGGYAPAAAGRGGQDINQQRRVGRSGVDRAGRLSFGNQCIVTAIDARRRPDGGYEVYSHGGRRPTGRDAVEWAVEAMNRGAGEILLTSMDADGTKNGFELTLTAAVSNAVSIPVIASGGAGHAGHMAEALTEGKADAVLAASIFHYGELTVAQVKRELARRGIPVRPAPQEAD